MTELNDFNDEHSRSQVGDALVCQGTSDMRMWSIEGKVYLDAELIDGKWFLVDEWKGLQPFRHQDKIIPFTTPAAEPQHVDYRSGNRRLIIGKVDCGVSPRRASAR